MDWLILVGLVIFIALHSLRSHFPNVRARLIDRFGVLSFRIVYSLITLMALSLIGWGLIAARQAPVLLWQPEPYWRTVMSYGMWWVALGVAASWIPGTHIRSYLKQPLLLAIVLWAILHLSVSAYLHQWILCVAILGWVLSVLWRDWPLPAPLPVSYRRDVLALIFASVLWFGFAQYLHTWLIGVSVAVF